MGSFSGGNTSSRSVENSYVDPVQAKFLNKLRTQSEGGLLDAAARGFATGNTLADQLGGAAQRNLYEATGLDTLKGNIDNLRSNLDQQFTETILPAIQSRFGVSKTGGGSRELIESIRGGEGVSRALSSGITELTDRSQQTMINATPQFQNAFNLGIGGYQGGAMPLLALNSIIGAPTVLGDSVSRSRGKHAGVGLGG